MKERLSDLAKRISIIGYIGAALVAAAYLINVFFIDAGASFSASLERLRDVRFAASSLLSALTLAVSVLVVAVPEGLPMMITVVLSSNMKRMIKKNVLVRRMVGIETSGSLSVLFCDKTGTLTEGRMGVTSLILPDAVISDGASLARDPLLLSCVLAPAPSSGQNPTDLAFTSFAAGLRSARVIRRLPFESARRFSAAAVASGENGRVFTVIRGAPELLAKHISYIREGNTLRRATRSDIDEIRSRTAKTASGGGGCFFYAPPRETVSLRWKTAVPASLYTSPRRSFPTLCAGTPRNRLRKRRAPEFRWSWSRGTAPKPPAMLRADAAY